MSTLTEDAGYPLRVNARVDDHLSRWLWIFKPILIIPHLIVLVFLWIAAFVATIGAGIAILFTGRYPRPIFDFNVGVMRWTWRASYYSMNAFATDTYPPFRLASDPQYPTDLAVDYPEKLSRGLVLVKWWLLAIPQYLVIAAMSGGFGPAKVGLVSVLALVGIVTVAIGRPYPKQLFDLVIGLNRWCLRVGAYALLMTDRYPPFRLDAGGSEPSPVVTTHHPRPMPAAKS